MRVLVTGGAGYIGSILTPLLLQQGHAVRVLDSLLHGGRSLLGPWSHPKFEFRNGDVRHPDTVADAVQGMDSVVHLAAIVGDPACAREPEVTRGINFEGSSLVLEKSMAAGVSRFIFASTCSNYGRMSDPTQLADESWELRPVSLYAETKVAVEEAILDLQRADFSPTVLRFATVYGVSPRMRFDLTVNEFTLDLLTKGELVIFGQEFWRPYVHVRDVARAVSTVLSAPVEKVGNQVFNVGSTEQNYQKGQLVDLIKPHVPNARIEYVHKAEDPRDYRVSFAKIKDALSFEAAHTVEQGIDEIVQLVNGGIIEDFSHPGFRN
jgi:nucleoside-diphosphate-sugar epimerase